MGRRTEILCDFCNLATTMDPRGGLMEPMGWVTFATFDFCSVDHFVAWLADAMRSRGQM